VTDYPQSLENGFERVCETVKHCVSYTDNARKWEGNERNIITKERIFNGSSVIHFTQFRGCRAMSNKSS